MATVLMRVPTGELPEKMAAMREWLNERRSEPSRFTYDRYGSIFAVCVDFSHNGEAEAFKNRVRPQEVTSSSSILVNGSSIPLARPKPAETMEQVSWWRLMAEEVRTDADEMCSTSAKEMMRSVAATYDRLAENLERRLGSGSDRITSVLG